MGKTLRKLEEERKRESVKKDDRSGMRWWEGGRSTDR